MSKTQFIVYSVQLAIDVKNDNFTDPTFALNRINELATRISIMEDKLDSISDSVISGFNSLISITRNENYLDQYSDEDSNDDFDEG